MLEEVWIEEVWIEEVWTERGWTVVLEGGGADQLEIRRIVPVGSSEEDKKCY